MFDFKLDESGDLELTAAGDIQTTESICQAVKMRLLWFYQEWRLGLEMGFPHWENTFVKNPSESKLRYLIRNTVMSVDGVTNVESIDISIDKKTRDATINLDFCTDEETFEEEVNIKWQSTD